MELAVDTVKKSQSDSTKPDLAEDIERVQRLVTEIQKVIVGQSSVIMRTVEALLADGHVLLEGVPGLAKTLLVSALGSAMGAVFRRIQMVPDMLPSDLIGTYLCVGNDFTRAEGSPDRLPYCLGGRNQQSTCQDSGSSSSGDAGTPGHRDGQGYPRVA